MFILTFILGFLVSSFLWVSYLWIHSYQWKRKSELEEQEKRFISGSVSVNNTFNDFTYLTEDKGNSDFGKVK